MTSTNALETIGLEQVHRLRQAGVINGAGFLSAAIAARDAAFWQLWARRALLILGVAHLLAGIVFFFAYNWADMPVWAKFAAVESGIVLSAVTALLVGVDRWVGQACLIASSALVGLLLAVVGQVYQTGADAYELFGAWALLILAWVLASRSAVHWLLWLAVLYLAFGLYGEQVLVPEGRLSSEDILVNLGAIAALVLAAREFGVRRGLAWLAGEWNRLIVLVAGFAMLFGPGIGFVFDANGEPLALIALVAGLAGAAIVYRRWLPDFAALVIAIGVASLVLMSAGYRLLDETIGFHWDVSSTDLAFIGLLVAWCVLVTGAAARLMRGLHFDMATRA
ncbi:MAG: DUF2157 domain-containing protein [Dongiaceae bacterium]